MAGRYIKGLLTIFACALVVQNAVLPAGAQSIAPLKVLICDYSVCGQLRQTGEGVNGSHVESRGSAVVPIRQ